jgi:hypothetical protein
VIVGLVIVVSVASGLRDQPLRDTGGDQPGGTGQQRVLSVAGGAPTRDR